MTQKPSPLISDKRRRLEILGVLLTAAGKFVFMDYLNWRLPFISICILLWLAYIILSARKNKQILNHWGFRFDNFREAVRALMPFALIAAVACFLIGFIRDSISIGWEFFFLLLLYPIWEIFQQFLVMSLIAGNLHEMRISGLTKPGIIIITAIMFGILHYPFVWLVGGTFILALFYGYMFLRIQNIFALGLFHGILGAIFYYTVVGRDAFGEVFQH